MNLEQLQKKLVAAARNNPPGDGVPYAFEKRILAQLAAQPATDGSALWARSLWRAAVPCVAVTLVLAALSFTFVPADSASSAGSEDLSQQFEQTLFASADQLEENW